MILTIDIGNTNITIGGYLKDELVFLSRLATNPNKTGDEYAMEIAGVLALKNIGIKNVKDAIIASVVPACRKSIAEAIKIITGKMPLVVGPGVKNGINIKIDNPSQLGADLVAGAVGAIGKYPLPCIIIDMGTTTTISALDKNGDFLGCSIAAGIRSTLNSLAGGTAQLSQIEISSPKSAIGTNTADSMRSGIILGAASMLDGMIQRMEETLGSATVVATGGLAEMVVNNCKTKIIVDNNLLLDGLYKIYLKNQ